MSAVFKRKFLSIFPNFKRVLLGLVLASVIFVSVFLLLLSKQHQISLTTVPDLILGNTQKLKSYQNRTNILLLGIGGENHDGGNLTDTMIVVSIDFNKKDALLLHVPRDIWIGSLKDKINAAYEVGESKNKGDGFVLAKATVEEIIGIPIHYAVLIDFAGFKDMIDTVGGIDVEIPEAFTDPLYPIAGRENDLCSGDKTFACRYETVTFTKGHEHMDGTRALKYVRSRHAAGATGTDFSRGQRQELVLAALKNKLLSNKILFNPAVLWKLRTIAAKTTSSDLKTTELLLLGRAFLGGTPTIRSDGLTQDIPEKGENGLLIHPSPALYDGKWVLIPKDSDFVQIGKYVSCLLDPVAHCEQWLK